MNMQPGTADHLQWEVLSVAGGVTDNNGNNTTFALPIFLPTIRYRSVRTTLTVPDGGTLLVSGLMTDVKFDASTGVPFFSDLPVVGRLFGTDLKQREKINLLILCSANILLFDEQEAEQL